MSKRFHINPNTGKIGECRAKGKCPFGSAVYLSKKAAKSSIEYKKIQDILNRKESIIFREALLELDSKLKRKIEIKAIGGYASLYYTQSDRYSGEIDNYSRDCFSREEEKIIDEIGDKYKLYNKWLNNRWAAYVYSDNILDNAKWEKLDYAFSNIDFYIISLEDLLESKFNACNIDEDDEDYEYRGLKDEFDIIMIAKNAMNAGSFDEMTVEFEKYFKKYPIAAKSLLVNKHLFDRDLEGDEDNEHEK